jgi:tripartite ATP-independent transporter DctP family solute receptor
MKKIGKQITSLLLAAGMIALAAGCGSGTKTAATVSGSSSGSDGVSSEAAGGSSSGEKITIRLGHNGSEENIYQYCAEAFQSKLTELLGEDRVEVKIFPNGTLGSQTEMIDMLKMGTLDAVTFGRHSQIDPRLEVLNLPFLFTTDEQQTKVLRGDEGKEIREEIAQCFEAQGIYMLGMFEAGNREITSTKKISSLKDLNGLVIRTPNTDVLMDSFEAWGASPTPMDINDLYTALQTKVVDAQENPYQLIWTNGYYEVCPYLCVTNHSTIPDEIQFSKAVFDKYPQDVQDAIREAGKYAADQAGEENNRRNAELLETLKTKEEVTEMPAEDLAQMKSIVEEKVYPAFTEDELSAKIVEQIQALAE